MAGTRPKHYLYVDETGQHSRGELFVVALAFLDAAEADKLHSGLLKAETVSLKGARKWVHTPGPSREAYLSELVLLCRDASLRCYYVIDDHGGTDYSQKLTRAVVSVLIQIQPEAESKVTIVIDGSNLAERQEVGRALRQHTFPFRREIRGGTDESNPFLRLADALAGFVRHHHLRQPYAVCLWDQLSPFLEQVPP